MSQETSTSGASEADPTTAGAAATGAAIDGGVGGTQAVTESDAFAAEREKLMATNRELQAAKDREAAKARDLEARLNAGSTSTERPAPAGLTLVDLMRVRELDRLSTTLKGEFTEADPNLFNADPLSFDSPEAYRLAVVNSHESRKAEKERVRAEVEADVRAKYAAVHGALPEEQTPVGGTAATGMPTPAQIAAMGLMEQVAFEKDNPGVIDKILAQNSTGTLISSRGDLS